MPRFTPASFGLALALFTFSGCQSPEEITTYEVERESPPRMLVAMVGIGRQVWFFKLNGSADAVESQEESFKDFLDSVEFDPRSGEPTWSEPDGWEESDRGKTGSFKRFGSYSIPTDEEILDVSVTTLSAPETGIDDQYLMVNLNRWREQVFQDPIGPGEDWKEGISTVSIDGIPGLYVDLVGKNYRDLSPRSVAKLPERDAGGPLRESQFEYQAPDHWQDRGAGAMVAQEWRVGEGSAEDTVRITLSFAGGGLAANINRWRGQVGLDPVPDDDLGGIDTEIDGRPAQRYELIGEQRAIVGIVAPQEGPMTLFVKMTGPSPKVEMERENFLEFAKTLKLK